MKFCLFLLLAFFVFSFTQAQELLNPPPKGAEAAAQKKKEEPITDFKIVSETTDSRTGQIIRTVTYNQGSIKITETLIFAPFPKLGDRLKINTDTMNMDSIMVLVDKPQYLVAVLYKRKRIRQYRATFGPDRMRDKMQEGDRKTPEGWFKILSVRDHGAWQKFMLLDYPNQTSYDRFQERKADGEIGRTATIGNSVGIHGTFKGGDEIVDMGVGWTDGCIALKSTDVYDLAKFVRAGTRVYITSKPPQAASAKK